jgi:hypothetical protein
MAEVAVLVPTSSASADEVQTHRDFRVIIRDEGAVGCLERREVRQFLDLLTRAGIATEYHRVGPEGVAIARRDLARLSEPARFACFVDDDMCLLPDAMANLRAAALAEPAIGFAQGQKIEADPGRTYWNDINRLNGGSQPEEPFRTWFGDAALLLVRREALAAVDWEVVARYRLEGLPGEDVAMSLMISDRFPCFGVPRAVGYHLSPARSRWTWEVPSDVLQLELLRPRVSAETLRRALPHLAEHLP